MLRAEITGIVVTDEKLFAPTGDIGRYVSSMRRALRDATVAAAPINKRAVKSHANAAEPVGSLKRGIGSEVDHITLREFAIHITSAASYTRYVVQGTGRIYSRSARIPKGEPGAGQFAPLEWGMGGMYLPPGMGHKALIRQSVSGQAANNFFEAGMRRAAIRHPSLGGLRLL